MSIIGLKFFKVSILGKIFFVISTLHIRMFSAVTELIIGLWIGAPSFSIVLHLLAYGLGGCIHASCRIQ